MTVSLEVSSDFLDGGDDGKLVRTGRDGADKQLGMLNQTEVEVAKLDSNLGIQRGSSSSSSSILIGIR